MAELRELLAYLIQKYPHKAELSKARLTKMIYLCDWKNSIDHNAQVTNVSWYYDNYGPFVWDIIDTAKKNPHLFKIENYLTSFGTSKTIISMQDPNYVPNLSKTEQQTADHVIEATRTKTWDGFIKLVYSTFPIVSSEKHETLNLPELAKEYKNSPMYQTIMK